MSRTAAQKNPAVTALVPASVRVHREKAPSLMRPRAAVVAAKAGTGAAPNPMPAVAQAQAADSGANLDDSYDSFMADMKELGAL